METRTLLLRPVFRCIAKSSPTYSTTSRAAAIITTPTPTPTTTTQKRHQSSTSRTKRALKIAPHPSFLTNLTSAESPQVIYNPPSSSSSVYHTPFKFLPRSDPRRQANLSQLLRSSSTSSTSSSLSISTTLPPSLKTHPKRQNVTQDQVAEMRHLRASDPGRWSVLKLAERYACTPYFVMMCCRSPAEHRERERARLDAVKAGWGPIRGAAREERRKRKDLLLRDAL
ncbi:hypothetical protein M426DRAFT_316464 [Hypoxylon sp. CI-4A]|nr:hypothetical protein M426DRAFT_316464 [Hypoxylon sp. CI-4A]